MAKNTEKKGALGMFENMSTISPKRPNVEIKIKDEVGIKATKENITKESVEETPKEEIIKEKTTPKISKLDDKKINAPKKEKKTSGRPNTRGEKGVDFQLINIAVPNDVYNQLRELSYEYAAGNMTFYINKILKDAIEKQSK